jgi:hypothetical protein
MNFPAALPVNYSNTAYFYPDETGILGSFTKAPDAKTLVALDYTSLLSALNLNLQNMSYVLDYGTAPQLVISGTTIQADNNIVSFIVSGGLNGVRYVLTISAAMSDGETVNIQYLEVVVSAPGSVAVGCGDPALAGRVGVSGGPPISNVYQQASLLNGDGTTFGSTFVVFWVSSIAPTTANILDRWYNTQDGLVYERVTDGQSVFWVAGAQRGTAYTTSPNAPLSPAQGDMWFNTNTGTLNMWLNTGSGLNWYVVSVPTAGLPAPPNYYFGTTKPATASVKQGDFWYDGTNANIALNPSGTLTWYQLATTTGVAV